MDVCGQATAVEHIVIEQPEVGDILESAVSVARRPGVDRDRLAVEHVVDDRDVVWRQVENDVDVVLVEAEVQPRAVDVVELAQLLTAHELAKLPNRRVVLKGVPDHENDAGFCRRLDQPPCPGGRRRQRFLDQDVLACRDSLQSDWHVHARRRRDHHGVHVRQRGP